MRKPIIIANWKMNKTVSEAIRSVTELKALLSGKIDLEVVIAPAFTSLYSVDIALSDSTIQLGAQNMHFEEQGAYTGEVSPIMLANVNCTHLIVGHSERRAHFNETNEVINRKVRMALDHELLPILCIGETREERDRGVTFDVIEEQLNMCLRGINSSQASDIVIAYEPVWAIGSGTPASPEIAQEVHAYIREKLGLIFRKDVSKAIRIIYGGSVDERNIREFMAQSEVDGALVGSASLDAKRFSKIVEQGV